MLFAHSFQKSTMQFAQEGYVASCGTPYQVTFKQGVVFFVFFWRQTNVKVAVFQLTELLAYTRFSLPTKPICKAFMLLAYL